MIAIDDRPVGVHHPHPPMPGDDVAAIADALALLLGAAAVSVTWEAAGSQQPPTSFGQRGTSPAHRLASSLAATGGGRCVTGTLSATGGTITIDARFADEGAPEGGGTPVTTADMPPLTRALAAAMDQADVAVLLIDGHARLMFANAAARAILDRGGGLRRVGAHIAAARPTDTLRLHAAIARVVDGGSDKEPPVAITRPDRRPLLVAIVASGIACTHPAECAAIVHVVDPEQAPQVSIEPTCRLYGLSPVEARLASLLADGISLAGAAKAMHVRPQTARSYLKQIFLKTDTHRQAELVWLLLRSAVRTPQPNNAA